jgi:hypothetical protein
MTAGPERENFERWAAGAEICDRTCRQRNEPGSRTMQLRRADLSARASLLRSLSTLRQCRRRNQYEEKESCG